MYLYGRVPWGIASLDIFCGGYVTLVENAITEPHTSHLNGTSTPADQEIVIRNSIYVLRNLVEQYVGQEWFQMYLEEVDGLGDT